MKGPNKYEILYDDDFVKFSLNNNKLFLILKSVEL